MKALKYLLYAVAALVVLVIVAIAIIAATFDPNDYKPQIVQLVKDKTGRTLTIEGDIRLKLFPKIGAAVGKVSLSDPAGTAEFAGLNQAQVYLALLPLLSRQVVVDQVRVDGLRANLVKHKDGSTNFDDLTGGGQKAEPSSRRHRRSQPSRSGSTSAACASPTRALPGRTRPTATTSPSIWSSSRPAASPRRPRARSSSLQRSRACGRRRISRPCSAAS